jgi:hypothetical protein
MTVAISGVITINNGASGAAGNVTITPDVGDVDGPTALDGTGAFDRTVTGQSFKVVIAITEGPTIIRQIRCLDGAAIDLSLDLGRAAGAAGEEVDIAAVAANVPAAAALTSVQNATTNAAVQSVAYVQADAETVATLANALKVSYNALQVDVAADRVTLNDVIAALVAAGIMAA